PSELIQLPNITKDEIEALVNYRIKKGIIRDKEELVLDNIISQNTFDFINIFIEAKESKKIEKDERPEMFVYKGIANEKTDNNSKAKIYQSLEYDYNDIQGYGLVERDAGEDEFDNLKKFGVKINNIKNKKIDIVAGNFNVGFGNFHTISTIMYEKRTKTVKEDNSIIPQIIDIDRQTNEDKYLQGIAVQKRGIFAENLNLSCFYSNKFYDDISDSIKSELKAEITGANFNYDFSSRLAAGILGFAGDFVCKDLPQYDFENAVFGMYLRYKSDYDVDITFEAAKSNKGGKGIMVGIDHKTKKYDLNIVIYSNDCDYVNMLAYKSEFSEKDKRGAKPELTVYLDRNHKLTASYELNKILSSDVTQRQSEIKINGNYDKKSALINRISFLKSFQYAFKFSFYNNDVNDWAGANPRGYEPYYYITYRDESVYKNPKQSYNFQFNFINNLDYTCNIDFYKKENFSYGKPAFNDDYSFLQKFRYKLDSNNEFQTDYYIKKYKDIKNYNLVSETAEYSQYWYFNAQYYRKFSKKDSVKFSYQYRDYENSSFQDFHRFGSELRLQNFSMVLKNYFKYYKESSSKEFEINLTKNW
ncbi:MAG TPA: hypothetical protein PLQ81_12265, partial [bacterium]|nr:hypothetical protein [bacterium]